MVIAMYRRTRRLVSPSRLLASMVLLGLGLPVLGSLGGCMMLPALWAGADGMNSAHGKQTVSQDADQDQDPVAVYHPEDGKLTCTQIGQQINRLWGQIAGAETAVRGERAFSLGQRSARPRLELLQKRYNVLLPLANEKQCQEWADYGPMMVGETEGTERVGKEARQKSLAK